MSPLPPAVAHLTRIPGPPAAPARWAARALDALFPPRCGVCGRLGSVLCAACLAQVRPVPTPVCRRCGQPVAGGPVCAACQAGQFHVSAIRAAAVYAHPLSTAIHKLKYQGRKAMHQPLGQLLVDYWRARAVSADLVIAVPLHERRQRERGFNQSQLLATVFCQGIELPLLHDGVLRRSRETKQQVLLGVEERKHNVAGAFEWRGPALAGIKVLLIDDVATTGSTLEACAEVLLAADAGKVWALTVARAGGGWRPARRG